MNDIAPMTTQYDNPHAVAAPLPMPRPFASDNAGEVSIALAAAQGEFLTPKRTKTANVGTYKYSYAPLEEIIEATRPALSKNGLALTQCPTRVDANLVMRTILWHGNEWIGCDWPIFSDKATAQVFGGGTTYARRYGMSSLLGIAPEDDDDGNLADGTVAEVKGKPTAKKPAVAPLRPPLEPPRTPEVFDLETGELTARKAYRIEVPMTPKGGRDWPIWGAGLIAAFSGAQTLEELREWEAKCTVEIEEAKLSAPRVFKSTSGAYAKAFGRLGPPADFMAADESADVPR